MFGKDSKKKELIKNLSAIYESVQREHQISPGDFPDITRMQVRPLGKGLAFPLEPIALLGINSVWRMHGAVLHNIKVSPSCGHCICLNAITYSFYLLSLSL